MTETGSSFDWKWLAIALALFAPFLVYFDTAKSIISIWNASDTFAHGYIIVPITLWLIWKRKHLIRQIKVQPCWPALLVLAACGFGWLLAELADVQVVRQYMLVLMLPAIIVVVLGWRIAWAMAFPLAFLILAVPFGEIFMAPLINFTADFTVAALQLSGIPVLREGSSFSIPSGNWSVVEACSGLRYLISSFTLGCLYAYLSYRSPLRRISFILFSILVPIIANGLRAYMIVMIGHFSGMTLAVGVDHLIYGWLFFGLVMFFMFWIGSFWSEAAEAQAPAINTDDQRSIATSASVLAVLAVLVSIGIWPLYASVISRDNSHAAPVQIANFQSDWPEVVAFSDWKPGFPRAYAEFNKAYQQGNQALGMHIGYYRSQSRSAGLISSVNQLVSSEDKNWHQASSVIRDERLGQRQIRVIESRLKGNKESLLVWQWYWINDQTIVNLYQGKMLQAKEKLLMQGDDGAALFFYAAYQDNPDAARATLREFLSTHLDKLESRLIQSKQTQSN